jgi:hypothetical protein
MIPDWIKEIFKSLMERGFYGKLVLSFENGKIVTARKEETLKPPK